MLDLRPAIHKLPKVVVLPPIKAESCRQICGSSTEVHNILMKIVNGEEGNEGCQWNLTKLCGLH